MKIHVNINPNSTRTQCDSEVFITKRVTFSSNHQGTSSSLQQSASEQNKQTLPVSERRKREKLIVLTAHVIKRKIHEETNND